MLGRGIEEKEILLARGNLFCGILCAFLTQEGLEPCECVLLKHIPLLPDANDATH